MSNDHEPQSHVLGSLLAIGAVLFLLAMVIGSLSILNRLTGTPVAPDRPFAGRAVATPDPAAPPAAPGGVSRPAMVAAASAVEGERLFNAYCVACHQQEGQGKVGFAPYIRNPDFLALTTDDFLRQSIVNGRPGTAMTPWGHLPANEIESLVKYLRSGGDPDRQPVAEVDPERRHAGEAANGEALYVQYCAACHGSNATGYAEGGPGPGIGNHGFLAVASDDYIFQTVKHGRASTAMRPFSGSRGLANLSDGEIGDVIAYLRSRDRAVPEVATAAPDPVKGKMHFDANCAACHQPEAAGRPGFAPALGNRDFLALASDEFIRATVREGRVGTAMVGRPDLSEAAVGDIIAYLRSLPVGPVVKIETDPSRGMASLGDHEVGGAKFAVYCATCHGSGGQGYVAGGAGPAIGMPGFLRAASDDFIYQTLKYGRANTAMRAFLGAGGLANLNDQDAYDIIAYMRSLEPAAP